MRALFLALDFKPRPGGVAELTHRLALRLSHRVDSVRVAAGAEEGAQAFDATVPYGVSRCFEEDNGRLGRARWIVEEIAASRADVLILTHLEPLAPHALTAARWSRTPLVVMTHGTEVNRRTGEGRGSTSFLAGARARFWKKRALRGADLVTASSHFTAERVGRLGVPDDRVAVLHPGVALPPETSAEARVEARRSLGLPSDAAVALFLGRLVERKGADRVVESLPEVSARVPGVRLLVAGDGPAGDALRRRAVELGVDERVRFLGEVSEKGKAELLQAADLLVMPNRELPDGDVEGFGIVFLEAAARGLPVVGGRSGGAVDAVVHGETGLLVDSGAPGAVAEGLAALLSDPARARAMGREGRRRVEKRFTWEHSGDHFAALLERIVP